ncbi:hypothetical protein NM208_g7928 [Fusarium decemcellulare]|uniref:Uncharacterized protein n=1 Tax=Fusarium decemcellulare TaxID=57161 RepID=A0ACC1S799_9HYPO|nr:hypothetical protein NM208_g7928 [Fusarium decemcellulare]
MSDHKTSDQPHGERASLSNTDHRDDLSDEKAQVAQYVENASPSDGPIPPTEIQARFELLRHLSPHEMEVLNKRVRSKIDWHMMPCVTLMFLMNYLDRINVSNARLAGLQEDLNMTDTVWNTGISTFYVGYLVGQLPGNLIMAKTNPRFFLPTIMLMWSAGTICMPAMTNGAGFCVVRFFIGLTEAPFFPGLTLMTSSWYTKEESPLRMAIWHAGNTISNIISGFLAAGILEHMDGIAGLHAWQWFFLIEGIVSILVALASYVFLPSWPHDTRFLTEEEREMAQYRILVSNGGIDEGVGGTWDGVRDAVKDPFTWFFCLMHFALVTAQSFKDFLPSIMDTFGFNKMTTYLIQAPPYAIAYIAACLLAWSCGHFMESTWHVIVPIIFAAGGCGILIGTINVAARYIGIILLVTGTYNGLNLQLSWETTVVPAPRAKKAALIAIANCISQVSHWFSPYFYPTSQEPYYRMAGGLLLLGCALTVMSALLVRWRAKKLNKKLDEREGWSENSGVEREIETFRRDSEDSGKPDSNELKDIEADKRLQPEADAKIGDDADVSGLQQAMQILNLEGPRTSVAQKNKQDESAIYTQARPQESHLVETRSPEPTRQENYQAKHTTKPGTAMEPSKDKKCEEDERALAWAEALASVRVQIYQDPESIRADVERAMREKNPEILALGEERHHVEQLAELAEARAIWKKEAEARKARTVYPKRQDEIEGIGYAPIKFTDALGRRFNFPFRLCRTWRGMEELIIDAFANVNKISPGFRGGELYLTSHVIKGHYDLFRPSGRLITPAEWHRVIQPGWAITMQMWPPEKTPSTSGDTDDAAQYPRRGISVFPAELVSKKALTDLEHSFIEEDDKIIVKIALAKKQIEEILKVSGDYNKAEAEAKPTPRTGMPRTDAPSTTSSDGESAEWFDAEERPDTS